MLGPSWPEWDEFYVFGNPDVPGEDIDTLFKNKIPLAFRGSVTTCCSASTRNAPTLRKRL